MRVSLRYLGLFLLGLAMAGASVLSCNKGDGREPAVGTSQGVDQTPNGYVPSESPDGGEPDAESADATPDAVELAEDEDEEEGPPPDISTLHASTRPGERPLGLTLDVAEKGPGLPWAVAIVNEGSEPVTLVADSRLLWFDVTVPGKRGKVTCRLPESMFPSSAEDRLKVTLDPGEGVVEAFDARLYCFAAGGQRALVPGALVRPYFGWQPRTKATWRGARKKLVPVEQVKPFVASLANADEDASSARSHRRDGGRERDAGGADLKMIEGQPFALRSEYKEWSSTRLAEEEKLRREPGPLELKMVQGGDAQAERNAIISVALKNRSVQKQTVYFRRELVSFEVVGPDGVVTCDPQPDNRAPDRQAFSVLGKKGSIVAASRLIELCPQDTFARPGLYLVHGRFDSNESGERFGLNAFVGRVVSLSPAAIRIRTGELPFLRKQAMRTVTIEPRDKKDGGT